MQVKMVLNANNLSKEGLRSFIQAIREWELRTPKSEVVGILINTDPELSTKEALGIFEGIYPPFKEQIEILRTKLQPTKQLLKLGPRAVTVGGKLLGTCDDLSLVIAEATEDEIKELENAQVIGLVKVARG